MKRILLTILLLMTLTSALAGSRSKEPAEPFERGIKFATSTFVPKGTVCTGVSVSYNTYSIGNGTNDPGYSMLFSLASGLKGEAYKFGIAPHVSYFVKDNLSVGYRFGYNRTSADILGATLSISDDLGFGIQDYHMLKHTFEGAITMRYYMPIIPDNKRFGIFAEIRALGAYGQSKTWKVDNDDKFGTYQTILKGALNVVPGICVFAHDNVAVEVAIGVLGIQYNRTDQIRNQVEHSVMRNSGMNFKLDLLSIELGTNFYFQTGQHGRKAKKNFHKE